MKSVNKYKFLILSILFVVLFSFDVLAASISKSSLSMYIDKTKKISLCGSIIKAVSSSNKKIATVSSNGTIKAKKSGTCYIYLKDSSNKTHKCKVKVIKPYISKKTIKITKCKTGKVKLCGTAVKSVSSSNKDVAEISKSGVISTKKAGTCYVYLKGANNKSYKCKVKVEAPTLNKTTVSIKVGKKYNLDLKGTAKTKKWYSSNKNIATVKSSGEVTAISEGETTVYVKCDGIKYTCKVKVSLKSDILKNKKLSILGDSISTYKGYNPSEYAIRYAFDDVKDVKNTWWNQLCRLTGMSLLKNASWSGSFCIGNSISTTSARAGCSTKRINDLSSNGVHPDIIICYMGTNDYTKFSPIGTWLQDKYTLTDKENVITFSEAYALMLQKIKKAYPNATIYCCTLLPTSYRINVATTKNEAGITLNEYNNVITETAKYFNAKVINLHNCGINYSNLTKYTAPDTVHPNKAGMKLISHYIYYALMDNYK